MGHAFLFFLLHLDCIFKNNKKEKEEVQKYIESNYGKVLLLVVWITKLQNQDNEKKFLLDFRYLQLHNFWEIVNQSMLLLESESLLEYANNLEITGIEDPLKCLKDNIKREYHPVQKGLLDSVEQELISPNSFNFKDIKLPEYVSWEEETLMNMLKVSIKDGEIIPLFRNGNVTSPDMSLWTLNNLELLRKYFDDSRASFIIDTIEYILFKKIPSEETMKIHCVLLRNKIEEKENDKDVFCSSYEFVSLLFINKQIKIIKSTNEYKDLIITLNSINNPELLIEMQAKSLPLSEIQKQIIVDYYIKQYEVIDNINIETGFYQYLENETIPKNIDKTHFDRVCEKFYEALEIDSIRLLGSLFYQFMIFLMRTKKYNMKIEKKEIESHMIYSQKIWEEKYYEKSVGELHPQNFSTTIPREEIDKFNQKIMVYPLYLADSCMLVKESQICNEMEEISEHALIYMISEFIIDPVYPAKIDKTHIFEKHEIDKLLGEMIGQIKEEQGYRLLNVLEIEVYVLAIHRRYKVTIPMLISMFHLVLPLYEIVRKNTDIELIEYSGEIKLAHITQLFPILEMKIRDLAIACGVFPYKENMKDFMKCKDPSSILREIIEEVYKIQNSFENIADLLFVYNCMYNGNSFNIRNECIHGRSYIKDNQGFAFKMVLLSIYMIDYRINAMQTSEI